jgi:cyclopropane fatty-acyl-phospholipid synthase-like methyltransferase
MNSLYDFPEVYDVVLTRPGGVVETEVRSLIELFAAHGIVRGKVLELACGACAHGIPLARAGFEVVGIDRSQAMLTEAGRRAAAAGVHVETVRADAINLDLAAGAGAPKFDAATWLFETFPLITEWEDIASHFDAVRKHLRTGGLYVVDIDAGKHGIRMQTGEWGRRTLDLPDGSVETWNEDLPGDWVQGTNHMVLHCRICLGDTVHETRDDWQIRLYSPWELALLARALDGWRLEGFYSWQDLSTDISDQEHYFTVFVAD